MIIERALAIYYGAIELFSFNVSLGFRESGVGFKFWR